MPNIIFDYGFGHKGFGEYIWSGNLLLMFRSEKDHRAKIHYARQKKK